MRPTVVVLLLVLLSAAWPIAQAEPPVSELTTRPQLLERLHSLHLLSDALIEKAATGRTPANDFQIQARLYREQLRQAMLANRDLAAEEQLPQGLMLSMVRMSALLHAAADCKSGRVIVCPPDLLRQAAVRLVTSGWVNRPSYRRTRQSLAFASHQFKIPVLC